MRILAIIVLSLAGCSCQDNAVDVDMTGAWQVVDFKANTPNLAPNIIEGGRKEALSSEFIFNANGESSLTSDFLEEGQAGSWSYDKAQQILTIDYADTVMMSSETYAVQSISASEMVWTQSIDGIGTLELTLEKD